MPGHLSLRKCSLSVCRGPVGMEIENVKRKWRVKATILRDEA